MRHKMLSELTLLYVEDEDDIRTELVEFLSRRFLNVYTAKNGKEGVESFIKYNPDMVLSDVSMPVMNGLDMAEQIKGIDFDTPVILITAFDNTSILGRAINIGVDGYIAKPINIENLINTIEKYARAIVHKKKFDREDNLLKEYKEAVDAVSPITKTDCNGIITYANDEFCKLLGYSKDELIGKRHNIIRHPDMQDSVFKDMWETILSKKVWKGVTKNRKKDGSECYLSSTIVPIKNEHDEIVEFLAVRFDITEQEGYKKILKSQLDDSIETLEEKILRIGTYETAIEMSNCFSRTDLEGNITYINDVFCDLSGYAKEEFMGKPHSIIRHPEMPKRFFEEMWNTVKAKKTWRGIIKNRKKDGSDFYVDTAIVPEVDAKGNIVEYISIRHDVTELKNLNLEIEETQREVIAKMGAIGETRSKETGNHVKRVAEYSKLLARSFGLSREEAELIKMASPMHDIGKVGIPDNILNKPGKLTDDEFKQMMTHSMLGHEMFKNSKRVTLKAASTIALEHHEKWNGRGYPAGKKGEEIHIYGRITAIADVFDALGSDRVYKKAWELERILDLFKQERGEHFDPKLTDLFFENLDRILEIRDMFRD